MMAVTFTGNNFTGNPGNNPYYYPGSGGGALATDTLQWQ